MIGWKDRGRPEDKTGRYRRGIGVGRTFHTSGTGAAMPGEVIDYSTAMVKVNEDGSVDMSTALMCHGGGTLDACAKLVAEEMGVPFDLVGISPASTTDTGYDVCTHATRGVYCGGGSAVEAAKGAKARLLEFASRLIEVNPAALQIAPDPETGEGVIFLEGAADKRITVREVAKTAQLKGWGTAIAVESHRMVNCPPCFVTNFVEVEVDTLDRRGPRAPRRVRRGRRHRGQPRPGRRPARGRPVPRHRPGAARGHPVRPDDTGEMTCGGMYIDYKMYTAEDMAPVDDIKTFFAEHLRAVGPVRRQGHRRGGQQRRRGRRHERARERARHPLPVHPDHPGHDPGRDPRLGVRGGVRMTINTRVLVNDFTYHVPRVAGRRARASSTSTARTPGCWPAARTWSSR